MSLTTCPNCKAAMFLDVAPRLPRVPSGDGFQRTSLICPQCWRRLVKLVPTDRAENERP